MSITIVETGPAALFEYGSIPSVLTVHEVFDVVGAPDLPGRALLVPRIIDPPYLKDYDAPPAVAPSRWCDEFDLSNWGFLSAQLTGTAVGRAAIAWRTPDVDLSEGRADVAVLWDLRVHPGHHRHGIGKALFAAVEEWARSHGARTLKVETQNINAPACRFYEAQGCVLRAFRHHAYPELPHEVQLLWYKDLAASVVPSLTTG